MRERPRQGDRATEKRERPRERGVRALRAKEEKKTDLLRGELGLLLELLRLRQSRQRALALCWKAATKQHSHQPNQKGHIRGARATRPACVFGSVIHDSHKKRKQNKQTSKRTSKQEIMLFFFLRLGWDSNAAYLRLQLPQSSCFR